MKRKGFTLIELLVVIAIIAILAAILFPVFVRAKAAAMASHCQSNMNQIGKAMKMYLSDWEDTFPTNRQLIPNSNPAQLTNILPWVRLSNPGLTDPNGEPIRFQYGYNWVEGLYPYVEKVAEGDAASAWKCPAARMNNGLSQGLWPSTTYAFNCNLVEMPEGSIKNAGNLLMVREMDRKYDSILRPQFQTLTSASPPTDPFLDPFPPDTTQYKNLKYKLHGDGSNILFSDGHVKNFPISYFHSTGQWDSQGQQWCNWVNTNPLSDAKRLSIAISP